MDLFEVLAVGGFAEVLDLGFEAGLIDPAIAKGDLLETGDLEALAVLDDLHKLCGVDQRVVCSGVEPGGAAAENFHVQATLVEVEPVQVCDLEFSALGRLEVASQGDDVLVVKVEAGDRVVGLWRRGFFLEGEDLAVRGELDDAVGLGLCYMVTEDGGAVAAGIGFGKSGDEDARASTKPLTIDKPSPVPPVMASLPR